MQLDRYVDTITRQLVAGADTAGPPAQELALRLALPLEAAVRLALLEALSAAAEEITLELAPGAVEVRLRSGEPTFAVSVAPGLNAAAHGPAQVAAAPHDDDEGPNSRINLRLPDSLKARVEAAAAQEGRSVNTWLVRAAAAALPATERPHQVPPREHRGPQRFTGWVQ